MFCRNQLLFLSDGFMMIYVVDDVVLTINWIDSWVIPISLRGAVLLIRMPSCKVLMP